MPTPPMNPEKYKVLILETIDQLRKRKARPDLERICHMLERRHGLKAADVQAQLTTLVDATVVIKVDYKGSTSYRNAAKWVGRQHLTVQHPALTLNSVDVTSAVTEAVRKNVGGVGAPLADIEKCLVTASLSRFTRETLQTALCREVNCGRVRLLPSGNYEVLVDATPAATTETDNSPPASDQDAQARPPDRPDEDEKCQHECASTATTEPHLKRKRFKKSHGPDFVDTASIASSDTPELDELHCDYCLMTAASNKNGQPEDLLLCKDCNARAHPSCMEYSTELAARTRMAPWQCIDCKTCNLCKGSRDGECMLVCDACDKGYHMSCHKPKLSTKPLGKWTCGKCNQEYKSGNLRLANVTEVPRRRRDENKATVVETNAGAAGLPTPCDSPISDYDGSVDSDSPARISSFAVNSSVHHYPQQVPDAKDWTIQDVVRFFSIVGFPEQAPAFREQEIDGKSLLLMKRSDVLTGLSIRLGPALKIYNHIKRLQTGLPDGHLIH